MKRLPAITAGLLIGALVAGCPTPSCPNGDSLHFVDGTYQCEGPGASWHPATARTLQVDLEAGTATISYIDEDDAQVVETWRIDEILDGNDV